MSLRPVFVLIPVFFFISLVSWIEIPSIQAQPVAKDEDELRERSLLGNYVLEIWKSCYTFKTKEGQQAYRDVIGSSDDLSVFCLLNPQEIKLHTQESCEGLPTVNSPGLVLEHRIANSNFEYLVFQLGNHITKVATIPGGSFRWHLVGAKIIANDCYPIWGARSVAPEVVLTWTNGNLRLDIAAMRQKGSAFKDLRKLRLAITNQFGRYPKNHDKYIVNYAPPELASAIFDFYYCGRCDLAGKFYDQCWPKGRPGKRDYWEFLTSELRKSYYWSMIKILNAPKSQDNKCIPRA
jgi:hypothetical protein